MALLPLSLSTRFSAASASGLERCRFQHRAISAEACNTGCGPGAGSDLVVECQRL